jgi:microcystin-dependent protein
MDPFVAEIRILPFNFPPKGWAFCEGQLLPLSQNTALFSLLGTIYGGDGKSTFALPDLQTRAPVHTGIGSGPGLSQRFLGEMSGSETVTLLESEIPAHTHQLVGEEGDASFFSPAGMFVAAGNQMYLGPSPTSNAIMSPSALAPAGGDQPHNNMQPYLALNFCIALQGVFPQRP